MRRWLNRRLAQSWERLARYTRLLAGTGGPRSTLRWPAPRATGATGATGAADGGTLVHWNRTSRAYFQRWLVIGALIGVVAGVGAILFFAAIAFCTHLFLELGAGFSPPGPAGEGATVLRPIARPWAIPLITTLGGLLTGLIVYTLAPEAEGHGTDAAIEAFHERGGKIRARIPPIKLVASAITIGSGGSAGREGPTAQIAAGFGSWLGDLLHLDEHDRRIAMAAGVGAGIGSIFKAPFGGALLSAEILYKRDFEAEALFPAFIASVVGFSIYGAWSGWNPVFGGGGQFSFTDPASLLGFLVLGIACGAVGLLYPTTLYGLRDLFHRVHIPNQLKPALGGLAVGLIGLVLPQALGMGYGYAQFAINGDFVTLSAWLMLALVFVKIVTTSLTIGSGGSGGVFGPGIVIGGFLGAALWAGLHQWAPWMLGNTPPGAFAVVGMGAFFGGIAKAPLAVILMVAEMTGEYSLIVPAMLATMIAYLVTGETSIYESQVDTRLDSPAHKDDFALPLLQSLTVRQAMGTTPVTAAPDMTVTALLALVRERRVASVLICEGDQLVGLVTATDLARVPPPDADITRARQIMSRQVVRAYTDESLYRAWLRMTRRGFRQLAVVERAEPTRLLGVVTMQAIGRLLRQPMRTVAEPAATASPIPGAEPRRRSPQASGALPPVADTTGQAATLATAESARSAADADEGNMDAASMDEEEGGVRDDEPPVVAGDTPGARSDPLEAAALHRVARTAPETDPLTSLTVADAMLRSPRLVPETEPLSSVLARLDDHGRALLVTNAAGGLVGIVTRTDLQGRRPTEDGRMLTAGDVAVRRLVTVRPEETLRVAARRLSRLGLRQLPVVPADTVRPVGLLRRSDVLAAYAGALGEESGASQAATESSATKA